MNENVDKQFFEREGGACLRLAIFAAQAKTLTLH
jgi:hypothetical protein